MIAALLQQAKNDQSLLDLFSAQDFGAYETETFHVTQLFGQQRAGRNLAICDRREIDYDDETNPRTRRIIAAYNRLGIRPITARH